MTRSNLANAAGLITLLITIIFSTAAIISAHIECKKEAYKRGYIQACKDFYQGKMKVDLIEKADGTREWQVVKPLLENTK